MSRYFPPGSSGYFSIPTYAALPYGVPFSVHARVYKFAQVSNGRIVSARETSGTTWYLGPSVSGFGVGTGGLRWSEGYSDGNAAFDGPVFGVGRWHDILVTSTLNPATGPTFYYDSAPQTTLVIAPTRAGTPLSAPGTSLVIGNRPTSGLPANMAIAELTVWNRVLSARDARKLTTYGPDALHRGRRLYLPLDRFGGPVVVNQDAPYHAVAAGSGATNYAPAPPRRKRRWWNLPLALAPSASTIAATGSAGEGEAASGTGTENITGTGSAGEGEGVSSTPPGTTAATGSAGEGEGASATGTASETVAGTGTAGEGERVSTWTLGDWQGVFTFADPVSGTVFYGQVYLPPNYDPSVAWPFVVGLHGSGESGQNGTGQLVWYDPAVKGMGAGLGCVFFAPQYWKATETATAQYNTYFYSAIMAALPGLLAKYHGNPVHTALTGYSAGAFQAYGLLYQNPGTFSALAPLSGHLQPTDYPGATDEPSALAVYSASAAAHVATWIYHGVNDPAVPIADARAIYAALQGTEPGAAHMTESNTGHSDTWPPVWAQPAFWSWLEGQTLGSTTATAGSAGGGEGAVGSGTVTGTGNTGTAGEGESASGSGTVGDAGSGTTGEAGGAGGSAGVVINAAGSAGEGEGIVSAGQGGAAGSGSAGEGEGAGGTASTSIAGAGTAGQGERAHATGQVSGIISHPMHLTLLGGTPANILVPRYKFTLTLGE